MSMSTCVKALLVILILALVLPVAQIAVAQDPETDGQLLGFRVTYGGRTYDSATNQTTFSYIVSGTIQSPDLSHFDLGIPLCSPPLIVVGTSPTDAVRFGVDPTTGVDGVKWDLPLNATETRTYTVTFAGRVSEGIVQVAVKGDTVEVGTITGPACVVASVDVDKFVMTDGQNWQDAGDSPGPEVEAGVPIWFRFVVTNIGNLELGSMTLSDSVYDTSTCPVPDTLVPGAAFECIIGPFPAVDGVHTNTVTISGVSEGETVTDADTVYYFSGDLPLIEVDKLITTDGGANWRDSAGVEPGHNIAFKFVVTNTGNVPLTSLALNDSAFDVSSCTLPAALEPGAAYECIIGPFPAGESEHTNTIAVSAAYQGRTITAADTASYHPIDEDDDLDVIIVIEGPVEEINVNIITIFGMDIEIDPEDSSLRRIRIGDTVRIEGDMLRDEDVIIIVAVNIIVVDIDILVFQASAPPSVPLFVPSNCKITGIGNNNPHLKCSYKGS